MKKHRYALILFTVLVISTLACNMPASQPPAGATEEPTEAPEVAQTEAPTEVATEEVPEGVTVSVSTATNCRTGPDVAYQLLMVVQPGSTNVVVGKYTPLNYWIINMPTGGTCWLWGAYATIVGDASTLPEIAAPAPPPVAQVDNSQSENGSTENNEDPTEEPTADNSNGGSISPVIPIIPVFVLASPPATVNVNVKCQISFPTITQTSTITWSSVSGATGYIVYKNGSPIANLGSGATQYIDNFNVVVGSPIKYGVVTVVGGSKSSATEKTVSACN